jgi:hypothetical protein
LWTVSAVAKISLQIFRNPQAKIAITGTGSNQSTSSRSNWLKLCLSQPPLEHAITTSAAGVASHVSRRFDLLIVRPLRQFHRRYVTPEQVSPGTAPQNVASRVWSASRRGRQQSRLTRPRVCGVPFCTIAYTARAVHWRFLDVRKVDW